MGGEDTLQLKGVHGDELQYKCGYIDTHIHW